jgi:RNA polymerase sigma-70 factor (ECF subfamily)
VLSGLALVSVLSRLAALAVRALLAVLAARSWRGLPRYESTDAGFAAWLYAIARHVVVDAHRAGQRSIPYADPPDSAADAEPSEDRVVLQEAVARLPEEQRQVIELKFAMGLSNDEVAAAMGKSPGAVNTMRWRALLALRKMLEDA